MKNIHFNQLKFKSWSGVLLVISLLFLFLGYSEFIHFTNERINKMLISIGFLCQIFFLGNFFWFKNYVEWNKLGMNIKINCFVAKSVNFNNVDNVELNNNNFIIFQKNGNDKIFKIDNININDLQKLIRIVKLISI